MKLRFHSKAGHLVSAPYAPLMVGQPKRYVGRRLVRLSNGLYADAATTEPFEVEEGTKAARRLLKLMKREQCLWPADEYTAKACGVDLVPIKQDEDGEWIKDDLGED